VVGVVFGVRRASDRVVGRDAFLSVGTLVVSVTSLVLGVTSITGLVVTVLFPSLSPVSR
jgi:hypothetical protein